MIHGNTLPQSSTAKYLNDVKILKTILTEVESFYFQCLRCIDHYRFDKLSLFVFGLLGFNNNTLIYFFIKHAFVSLTKVSNLRHVNQYMAT